MEIYRQGDVTLVRVGTVVAPLPAPPAPVVLAEGETSGHWHEIACTVIPATWALDARIDDLGLGERAAIAVPEPTELIVQGMPGRHTAILIPPGTYEVLGSQREYVPGEVPRRTVD